MAFDLFLIEVFKKVFLYKSGLYVVSPVSIGVFCSDSLTLKISVISTDYR